MLKRTISFYKLASKLLLLDEKFLYNYTEFFKKKTLVKFLKNIISRQLNSNFNQFSIFLFQ